MGLFGKIFEKKVCDICGGEIGLLGNKKLEDGNMCKNCAAKLSPWFSERKSSTIEEIKEQLEYREANKQALANFNTTSSYGDNMKVLMDERAGKFVVTSARDLVEANPDVIDFSQVTGVNIEVDESSSEEKMERKKPDGTIERVSYNPPKFYWNYDFYLEIRVNHKYFDDMRFQLNRSEIELNPNDALPASRKPDLAQCVEYKQYDDMAKEIKATLMGARDKIREDEAVKAAPKMAIKCPYCGATTTPDASGRCEFCGGAINN